MAASNHGRRMETLGGMMGSALAMLATAASAARGGPPVVYVDDDAPAGGNGQSWATAFRDLQDALAEAGRRPMVQTEIRIAQGVYRPDRGSGDRTSTFSLLSSAPIILGGFAGLGSADPNERDPARFTAVLSGDLQNDDQLGFLNRDDNAHHVMTIGHARDSGQYRVTIDGLTVRGGTGSYGGGILITNYSGGTDLTLRRVRLTDNMALYGGGMFKPSSSGPLTLEDCVFDGNAAVANAGALAAGDMYYEDEISVQRCVFANNHAIEVGGCMVTSAVAVTIMNSLFTGNTSGSGAEIEVGSGQPASFVGCTMHRTTASPHPMIRANSWGLTLRGCIVWQESAPIPSDGLVYTHTFDPLVEACNIRGGAAAVRTRWGIAAWHPSNISTNPGWVNARGADGSFETWEDADYSLIDGSPCIDAGYSTFDLADSTDLRGAARVSSAGCICSSRPDIGAFERQYVCDAPARPIVYVRQDSAAEGDGTSWSRAFRTLSEALDTPGVREIWVAQGVYVPTSPSITNLATFGMNCDVAIYGGFVGAETYREQRDPAAHPTILSGDLAGNDGQAPWWYDDNAIKLVSSVRGQVRLDGLTIRDGFSRDLNDGAVFSRGGSLTIDNCLVTENWAFQGSAVQARGTDVLVSDSLFLNNHAGSCEAGCSMSLASGTAVLVNSVFEQTPNPLCGGTRSAVELEVDGASLLGCRFVGHYASGNYSGAGTALTTTDSDNVAIVNCEFIGNRMRSPNGYGNVRGVAARLSGTGHLISNCLFIGNRAENVETASGSALYIDDPSPVVANCTFAHNSVEADFPISAGARFSSASSQLINCIFRGNRAGVRTDAVAQIDYINGALITPVNCNIQNWNDGLPGINTFSANPRFIDPLGPDGVSGTGDEDYRLAADSPCVDAGDTSRLPLDVLDLDRDGNTSEPLPLDLAGAWRVNGAHVDIGAYESGNVACRVDVVADGRVDTLDFFTYLSWFFESQPRADIDRSGAVNSADFFVYFTEWARGC